MRQTLTINLGYRCYEVDLSDQEAIKMAIKDLKFETGQQKEVIEHVKLGLFGDAGTIITAKSVIIRCRAYLNTLKIALAREKGEDD